MKKICTLALTLVLTAALFTGCGCTNTERDDASTPTGMTETMPTISTTQQPTQSSTAATQPSTQETFDSGNGMLEDDPTGTGGATGSTSTTEGTMESRSRSAMPRTGR